MLRCTNVRKACVKRMKNKPMKYRELFGRVKKDVFHAQKPRPGGRFGAKYLILARFETSFFDVRMAEKYKNPSGKRGGGWPKNTKTKKEGFAGGENTVKTGETRRPAGEGGMFQNTLKAFASVEIPDGTADRNCFLLCEGVAWVCLRGEGRGMGVVGGWGVGWGCDGCGYGDGHPLCSHLVVPFVPFVPLSLLCCCWLCSCFVVSLFRCSPSPRSSPPLSFPIIPCLFHLTLSGPQNAPLLCVVPLYSLFYKGYKSGPQNALVRFGVFRRGLFPSFRVRPSVLLRVLPCSPMF